VATAGAELLHVPPGNIFESVTVLPMQSVVAVLGVIAGGVTLTVKVVVTLHVPMA
jgi:hypothetical protein